MNNKNPHGYMLHQREPGYKINQEEAELASRLFEQAQVKGAMIRMYTNNSKKAATPKRAIIYARSATSQEKGNIALISQIEQCKDYCTEQGYTLQHIYQDEGFPGSRLKRPRLDEIGQATGN